MNCAELKGGSEVVGHLLFTRLKMDRDPLIHTTLKERIDGDRHSHFHVLVYHGPENTSPPNYLGSGVLRCANY